MAVVTSEKKEEVMDTPTDLVTYRPYSSFCAIVLASSISSHHLWAVFLLSAKDWEPH